MINKVMIDSSVLIEFIKDAKTKLLTLLIADKEVECFINEIVVSEFLYHFIGLNAGRSPRAAQAANALSSVFTSSYDYTLIDSFSFLPTNDLLVKLVPELMMKYNLLPNDAIIIATCKIHGITQLASHDTDFVAVCNGEGISLLTE